VPKQPSNCLAIIFSSLFDGNIHDYRSNTGTLFFESIKMPVLRLFFR
jgi:hypothetical protein